jgi:hypothetical protein
MSLAAGHETASASATPGVKHRLSRVASGPTRSSLGLARVRGDMVVEPFPEL